MTTRQSVYVVTERVYHDRRLIGVFHTEEDAAKYLLRTYYDGSLLNIENFVWLAEDSTEEFCAGRGKKTLFVYGSWASFELQMSEVNPDV